MASLDQSFSEKRNFIRMKINTKVVIHYAGREYHGVCKDLSGAGMLIETDEQFNLGDLLDVSIEQKGETHLPFNAKVEVTRITTGSPGAQIVGLVIREINE
jgi:hypothetical protein